ncbi:hypothetical protein Bca52824_094350 [Brassica carinata]|uniref:Uncharacterized protein n=1 Tax=Brassica carinata TaxID=52824 RepID=A0A8X7TJ18_BRACI|nr:hypothetical protein Bca52824_094350 [Brassica carinata]
MNVPEAYSSSICLLEGCWMTPSEISTTNVETAVRSAGGVPALRTAVSTLLVDISEGVIQQPSNRQMYLTETGAALEEEGEEERQRDEYQRGSGQNAGTSGSGSDHQ